LFEIVEDLSASPHRYLCLKPNQKVDWQEQLARVYIDLRGGSPTPLSPLIFEGVQILDVSGLRTRIERSTLPKKRDSNFDVVRSDFGEVWSYVVLEGSFSTMFGYKQVRDRESIQWPGRGIDAIGVEYSDVSSKLALILVETKVSDEPASPPQVVDMAPDSLKAQHQTHLTEHDETCRKVWDVSRRALKQDVRNLLFTAALYLQDRRWDKLDLVCCCFLVRSTDVYQPSDFGSFRSSPSDYSPSLIRFLIMRIPGRVNEAVNSWYSKAMEQVGLK